MRHSPSVSIALVGFGLDSVIEVVSGAAALWRLHADVDVARREHAERSALRIIGACFLGLALYVGGDAGHALFRHEMPAPRYRAPSLLHCPSS